MHGRLLVRRLGRTPAKAYPLGGLTSIGRDASNTVVIDSVTVSRWHALVLERDGRYVLRDIGSKNGLMLSGRKVTEAVIGSKDVFVIGDYHCQVIEEDTDGFDGPKGLPFVATASAPVAPLRPALPPGLFVGVSAPVLELLRRAKKSAESALNLLIVGETGSGKGVTGRLIHGWSARATGPFVSVNCAAIPSELVESELFGHRKGAFTGAIADRTGKFQAAHGGTLFLDEIGDMSLAAQAKILTAIEDRLVEPVGGPGAIAVDVRLVAATNKDLENEVGAGRFRLDLLYRLSGVTLRVPPLRECREDISLMANWFLEELVREMPAAKGSHFTPAAIDAMLAYAWPGNVRQLRHVVAGALVMKESDPIDPEDLHLRSETTQPGLAAPAATATLDEAEASHIAAALRFHEGNITKAAKSLGVSRQGLRDRIKRLGISAPEP